jgi:hypothetical protein
LLAELRDERSSARLAGQSCGCEENVPAHLARRRRPIAAYEVDNLN